MTRSRCRTRRCARGHPRFRTMYAPRASAANYYTFDVAYDGTTLKYSVIQGGNAARSVAPSATGRYHEFLTYPEIIPGLKRRVPLARGSLILRCLPRGSRAQTQSTKETIHA
jgi:hypothetical protein